MTRPSFATYLTGVSTRLLASGTLVLAATTFAFAFCVSPQAGAHTRNSSAHLHRTRVHAHAHGTGAQAHKAACSATHTRHDGSHDCSSTKGHKHKAKLEAHRKHATGSRHALVQGKAQTPPAPAPSESPGTTCSNGIDATLDEEGSFACANGAEPGCQEGFAPVVADDGSTLVCEPEQNEASGEEES